MRIETTSILGVEIARMTLEQVLDWVRVMVEQGKPRHIVTANAEIVYRAYADPEFLELLDKADIITPDGSGVVWASRFLDEEVPERVTGIDLVETIFQEAEEKGWGVYFLGAAPEVVEKAVLNTLSKHTALRVVGYHNGYFSQEESAEVLSNIKSVEPDILLVALGVPKQEMFIQTHLKELQIPISIGVGGSFDVLAGIAQRAPLWMQKAGLEWLYRLYKEPSRIGRMLVLPKYVLTVLRQKYNMWKRGSK